MNEETATEVSERRHRVERLMYEIGILVREHLREGAHKREKVYEVLNALAAHAAFILVASGDDPDAWEFFRRAMSEQMAATRGA